MSHLSGITITGLTLFAVIFTIIFTLILLSAIVMFIIDRRQTRDAVRHNYPVVGRFRALFTHLGEFFRQYFFAMDREEMPFNRAERNWIYRSAAGKDNTLAFGSTRPMGPVGTAIFTNAAYPPLADLHEHRPSPIQFGPHAKQPYEANSIINISAMSFGALSAPAVTALSRGAKKAGCWLNTGEGGLSPYHLDGGCDIIMQIGTAKYGLRDKDGNLSDERLQAIAAHEQVKMFELKLAQGAKPGKGGILPGVKVTQEISDIRGIPIGNDSISPNRHLEVSNNAELLALIRHIRNVTGKPTGFKTVMGDPDVFDELCAAIAKAGLKEAPDFITIDSGDGGSGAAPMALMDNCGMMIRESLPLAADSLTRHSLKGRVRLIASGKIVTPSSVALAYCAGADMVVSARGFLFSLGCIQALKCNKNTCPTGITTHNPHLQQGLDPSDKAERVKNFVNTLHHDVGIIAHSCGVDDVRTLKRNHVRVVQENGRTKSLAQIFPTI